MKPVYHNTIEQGTEEWHALRCGMLTASTMKLILTPTLKVANNDKTRAHAWELAAQRVTGYTEPTFINDAMLRGINDEPLARDLYSEKYSPVTECGYITTEIEGFTVGYSPDGLVGDDGLIEVKSRSQKGQIETIVSKSVPDEFVMQLQTGLLITGRKWIDFISYCGGMPMFVLRVEPDDIIQDAIIKAIVDFESKVAEIVENYSSAIIGLYPTERIERNLDIVIQ